MTRRKRLSLGSTLARQFECEDTKLISLFQTFTTKISFFETKKSKSLLTPLDYQATRQQDEA